MTDKLKVVVVDDDQGACLFIKRMVEKTADDVLVLTTTDPKTAMELCLKEKPVLIILDNVMPEVKGSVLVKSLRKNAQTKKTPIMMITGKGEMVYTQEKQTFEWRPNTPIVKGRGELEEQKNHMSIEEAYGVDRYLSKPVNTQKFLDVVSRILEVQRNKVDLDAWKSYQ